MNEELYTRIDHDDGRIEFVPKVAADCDWGPEKHEKYFFVSPHCEVDYDNWHGHRIDGLRKEFGNIYKAHDDALKARDYMIRSNSIIRACLLVDPDFVPDWGGSITNEKWGIHFSHASEKWVGACHVQNNASFAYVSTLAKAQQACALLTKWGVK